MPIPPLFPPILTTAGPLPATPPAGPLWSIEHVQRELDILTTQIERAASSRTSTSGYELVDISTALERIRAKGIFIQPGEKFDVDILITDTEPEQAGLYLSFGGTSLDLLFGDVFEIVLSGVEGSRLFSFVSGNALADIAAAFGAFENETGIEATASGTGILLLSQGQGGDSFVSVRTTNCQNCGLTAGSENGVYRLSEIATPTANSSQITFFPNAHIPVTDFGNNFRAELATSPTPFIAQFQIDGSAIEVSNLDFRAEFEVKSGPLGPGETANASNPGIFRAFTILYAEPPGPLREFKVP